MTARNYYTSSDTFDFEYCITPKALFKSDKFIKLSDGAKLLYVAILNRLTLSIKNGWQDEEGRVYIYYSLEEVCKSLGCSLSKAVRLFKEIDCKKGAGLIERKRLGLGKTSIIYVLKQESESVAKRKETNTAPENPPSFRNADNDEALGCEDVFFDEKTELNNYGDSKETVCAVQNDKSEFVKTENPDWSESASNKNNINNNKFNNNNFNKNNINQSITSPNNIKNVNTSKISDGWIDEFSRLKKIIKNNISYETLVYSVKKDWLDEIVGLMADTVCSGASVKINNIIYPPEAIRERFLSLKCDHIEYVKECLDKNTVPVRNMRAYMLTVLYCAPDTMMSWYSAEVRRDMGL